jgi:hypothetical protein
MVSKRLSSGWAAAGQVPMVTFEDSKEPKGKKNKRRYNDIEVVCIFLDERKECDNGEAVGKWKTRTGWDGAAWELDSRGLR